MIYGKASQRWELACSIDARGQEHGHSWAHEALVAGESSFALLQSPRVWLNSWVHNLMFCLAQACLAMALQSIL